MPVWYCTWSNTMHGEKIISILKNPHFLVKVVDHSYYYTHYEMLISCVKINWIMHCIRLTTLFITKWRSYILCNNNNNIVIYMTFYKYFQHCHNIIWRYHCVKDLWSSQEDDSHCCEGTQRRRIRKLCVSFVSYNKLSSSRSSS